MDEKKRKLVGYLVYGVIVAVFLLNSFYIVRPGEVGVCVRLGKIKKVSDNGMHFKLPIIDSVTRISLQIGKDQVKSEAASKDLQQIDTVIALNYGILQSKAADIFSNFQNRRNLEERIVAPSVQETMKAVTAKFTAEELITQREQVSAEIRSSLEERLKPFGIVIDGVAIINFDFSKQFSDSVEEKNVAVQKALTAQRDLERIKIEAEQKVATARAEAESLRLQKTEVTPAILHLRAIEKWDGKLPQVMNGSNSGMMMNLGIAKGDS